MSSVAGNLAASLPAGFTDYLDPQTLLTALGNFALAGVILIIFAECGLLIGFFLPGDSLLFITGLFIATGAITTPIWLACLLLTAAAILGNIVGYWIGAKAGPAGIRSKETGIDTLDLGRTAVSPNFSTSSF